MQTKTLLKKLTLSKTLKLPKTFVSLVHLSKKLIVQPKQRSKTLLKFLKNIKCVGNLAGKCCKKLHKSANYSEKIVRWIPTFSFCTKLLSCVLIGRSLIKVASQAKSLRSLQAAIFVKGDPLSSSIPKKRLLPSQQTPQKQSMYLALIKASAKTAKITGTILSATTPYQKVAYSLIFGASALTLGGWLWKKNSRQIKSQSNRISCMKHDRMSISLKGYSR